MKIMKGSDCMLTNGNTRIRRLSYHFRKHYQLYLLLLPAILFFAVFCYWPMYGVQIAFKDFTARLGIWGSKWVGLKHFQRFFRAPSFWSLIINSLSISLYTLIAGFPMPIILALIINEIRSTRYKKFFQTITYAPHFISAIVMVSMLYIFLGPEGIINRTITSLGGKTISFMSDSGLFRSVYVWSGIWQNAGWNSIIYLSALAGIDPGLHESAMIDGASRFQRIWHVNIPGIIPTAVIMFILQVGSFMSIGFEKIYLMQNPLNLATSEVITTYVYKAGLQQVQFSFSAAVGMFNSVINLILLSTVNMITRKMAETSLW